ncbi:hypothetical protein KDH_23890 [Dictyobacter sp. S3.2.2.5]|uniref:Carrier domain-containing protein n=1 Tax=Dictyobacter halimunensis TaxID=3026934 RepID=A0ABQ6FPE9_9CHLR|nr:hypothetical protein KDH_23890 [Dictyobacter sp. S3.2.2.5]
MDDQLEETQSVMEEDEEQYFFAPSFIQEGLWLLNQIDEVQTTYRVLFIIGLHAALDLSLLKRALEMLIERHEILRTSFVLIDSQPMQAIALQLPFELPYNDLSEMSPQEQKREIARLGQELIEVPLSLDNAPLFRVTAIHLNEQEQLLFFLTHHIIMDGPSYQIFHDEITHLYSALLAGEEPQLPELSLQYADYAAWQRETLQGEEAQPLIDYWRQQLGGMPDLLELPTDYPRPAVQTHQGAAEHFVLSSQISEGLERLARSTGTTLFMVLLSGFTMLLHYYSGQEDIVVGTPASLRTRSEFASLIGPFLTTLLLRTDLTHDPTFLELLMRIRTICIEAYSHQEMPFEYLVEILKPARSMSYNPLFQVFFAFNNFIAAPTPDESSPIQHMDIKSYTARFDLSCDFVLREQKLSYILEYDTALFSRETIVRMGHHLQKLLEEIVADVEQRLSQLSPLTSQERGTLISTWNSHDDDYARDSCIHELFAAQVARVPQAIAIACDGRSLTYEELDARAERVARYLLAQGIKPESLIGLCLSRSEAYVICVLGILKAGAAYIPLDPEYPAERLRFIIEDANVWALLTGVDEQHALPEYSGPVFLISDLRAANDTDLLLINRQRVYADNLAYVLYTSGSTGRPKGIQISHRAVVNFITAMQKEPGFTEQDILLAVTSFSFDISGLELFLPLLTGGRVELATREMTLDSQQLLQKIAQSGATVMQATPVTWRMLLLNEDARFAGLKVLCGGEALPQDLAQSLLARGADLWNMYGPTETTIWSLIQRVQNAPGERAIVPIGAPIANTQVYILDAHDHLLPVGIPGELVIGGDGLARGYLRRPDLTAERFMPDPFGQRPGARLYRTGDRARWLNDGTIEFWVAWIPRSSYGDFVLN